MSITIEELKQHLLAEKERLLQQVSKMGDVEYHSSGYGNHMADDATETFEQAKEVSLRRNEVVLLEQVEQALQRFEQGVYGICESCGAPIDRARLEAIPYARCCLDCQSRVERGG
ncbi:MAG: TraR/DksA C4-type zinc finger protein [Anaerolineae bacterium]|nr:TraR/DksA C4-type zinc finger protein [Anaerolineae bacterium]